MGARTLITVKVRNAFYRYVPYLTLSLALVIICHSDRHPHVSKPGRVRVQVRVRVRVLGYGLGYGLAYGLAYGLGYGFYTDRRRISQPGSNQIKRTIIAITTTTTATIITPTTITKTY